MSGDGPVPTGTGPSSSEDVEALRRRLYARGASATTVAEYERSEPPAPPQPTSNAPTDVAPDRRLRRLLVPAAVVVLIVVLVVALRPGRPEHLDPPALAGETIATWGRDADPPIAPDAVTYQPQGYTVFQPEGRVVHLAFRCVGSGTVTVNAGAQDRFLCDERVRTFRRTAGAPRETPFMLNATTVGDVVWSARVVLRDR